MFYSCAEFNNVKQMQKFVFIFLFFGHSFVFAQATANFIASVTIIDPVSIISQTNLNFATISASSAGTVILNPDDSRSSTGGVKLENGFGISAEKFLIKGEESLTVNITLPIKQYKLSGANHNISLHSFTSNLPDNFQLKKDSVALSVGPNIEFDGPQTSGIYRSIDPMSIVINYN